MLHLVADDGLIDALKSQLPADFDTTPLSRLDAAALVEAAARGEDLVWIGPPDGLPPELWVGGFRPADGPVTCTVAGNAPLPLDGVQPGRAVCASAYLKPPKEMPQHNVDEEIRADFLPLFEARDPLGQVAGWPGVLVSHYAPSLAAGRYAGSEQYFFLFDRPTEVLDAAAWNAMLHRIARRAATGLQVRAFDVNYASIAPGERIGIRTRIHNARQNASAVDLRFFAKAPGEPDFQPIQSMRRVPAGGSDTEAVCDFKPGPAPGLWTVRMDVCADLGQMERLSVTGHPEPFDRRELAFVVMDRPLQTPPIIAIDGPNLRIEGREAFWAGTHYYPSSSWWEWAWRDFRVLKADQDFDAMRRAGYRIVRVWVDPVLDEPVLRAMDAAIWIAARHGIVLDVCVFNQWTRQVGFERSDGSHVSFDFRDPRDFNLVSISLRHLDLQQEYLGVLALRWKGAGNLVYDLTNECYIKDPDPSQMDPAAVAWEGIPSAHGARRDTLLFRRWAQSLKQAARNAGAQQPLFAGYMFSTMGGGDNSLGNADSDIVPWHSYLPAKRTASTLQYMDPACTKRPLLLEEFGIQARDPETLYDADTHYALAGGAAAAMSYEWGVSWMSRESCYWPLPLREALADHPDPRWFAPFQEIGKSWSDRGVGLCGTPSGFGYGSIYHGTPFPAGAAVALGRMGLMGEALAREVPDEKTYVLIPEARPESLDAVEQVLMALWREKAVFGIWQEACLDRIPQTVSTLICPAELGPESNAVLESLRARGTKVYLGEDRGWVNAPQVERVLVEPGEGIDVHVRRTRAGTLYLLASPEPRPEVTFAGPPQVTLGLEQFGMIQVGDARVNLVEGAGRILLDSTPFCSVESGRVVLVSEDGQGLSGSRRAGMMVTEPTSVTFEREVTALAASDGRAMGPQAVPGFVGPTRTLRVPRELTRYLLHVTFEP